MNSPTFPICPGKKICPVKKVCICGLRLRWWRTAWPLLRTPRRASGAPLLEEAGASAAVVSRRSQLADKSSASKSSKVRSIVADGSDARAGNTTSGSELSSGRIGSSQCKVGSGAKLTQG